MSTFFSWDIFQTESKARTQTPSSFASTSCFVQKKFARSWTHSKYDTVTPPPFARMSGITRTPFLYRMSSASGVVGPLAPSAEIFARTRGAFSDVITFSRAQGPRMATSSSEEPPARVACGFLPPPRGGVHRAGGRRLVPAEGAADREGLARHDAGHGEALV